MLSLKPRLSFGPKSDSPKLTKLEKQRDLDKQAVVSRQKLIDQYVEARDQLEPRCDLHPRTKLWVRGRELTLKAIRKRLQYHREQFTAEVERFAATDSRVIKLRRKIFSSTQVVKLA